MHCSPFASDSALRPVIELFDERTQADGDASPEARSATIADGLEQLPHLDTASTVPFVLELLGLPAAEAFPLPSVAPEALRERTLDALCALLLAVSQTTPVIIEVEDLQWADPSTLELLDVA